MSSSKTRRALDSRRDALRAWAKTARARMSSAERDQHDSAIAERLERFLIARGPLMGHIASYAPFGSESAAPRLWAESRRWRSVCLPVVSGREMRFFSAPRGPTEIGAWGIPEPDPRTTQEVAPSELAAVLTPGLVFGVDGHRVGYGGGYYDRWFEQSRTQAIRIGICYEWQRVDRVPSMAHDQTVDFIVTETGCWPAQRDTPRSE